MIFLPLVLLSISAKSLAATCYEGTGQIANIQEAWDLREQVCGHNACKNSDAARGNNHYCNVFRFYNSGTAYVQLERNDPSGQYKNCWDAFENILQQCMNDPNGSGFKNQRSNGNWKVGNEWYWIHFNLNAKSGNSGSGKNCISNWERVNAYIPSKQIAEHSGMDKVHCYEWASTGWKFWKVLVFAAAQNPV
ncbi:hypothetical protein DE146DRAFT_631618 [Phaeosphaeria sp. MPI-PUGE-AT-0046c]|nr:hypothetical protein DE146DRAFT_631618 [Phaeosphaeria sp. MPI-PUGE-AT-0046c]